MLFKRKKDKNRQNWKPHWSIRLLYHAWMAVFTAFKIAVGAAATALMIVVVFVKAFFEKLRIHKHHHNSRKKHWYK